MFEFGSLKGSITLITVPNTDPFSEKVGQTRAAKLKQRITFRVAYSEEVPAIRHALTVAYHELGPKDHYVDSVWNQHQATYLCRRLLCALTTSPQNLYVKVLPRQFFQMDTLASTIG